MDMKEIIISFLNLVTDHQLFQTNNLKKKQNKLCFSKSLPNIMKLK